MKLVIVESPTKARTLSRFLGKEYEIGSSMGHLRDLPSSKLAVDVAKDFSPEYVVVPGKEEVVKKLQGSAKKADEVYLSMDPDREGEAIAYHVRKLIGENGKFQRVVFHQITKSAIEEAFAHPRKIDISLVNAQQARRILDRLVGYTLSPLLWKKVRRGLSAGRVQTVAVRLIVEREREITAFVPEEYWEIAVTLTRKGEKKLKGEVGQFRASLAKIDDKKPELSNGEQAEQAVADLRKATYAVSDVYRKEARRRPYPPFTTSTLQQSASNTMGFTAKRTMRLAQQLYEMGHITYHRTDSVHLAPEAVAEARKLVLDSYGKAYIPPEPRAYRVKSKLAQEAHEAIRPTHVKVEAEALKVEGRMARDLQKLYRLIRRRFLASQMSDAIYDRTRIDVEAIPNPPGLKSLPAESKGEGQRMQRKVYLLRANGSIRKFEGWRKLFKRSGEDVELPELAKGESLKMVDLDSQQKFTEPPPRYSDASLVRALEELGIGRPSTYAPIISTILARQYVEYEDRRFVPTPVGMSTNDFLVKHFTKTVDYDFTASLEEELDKIALGKRKWVPVIREFWGPFHQKAERVEKNAKRVKVPTEGTGKKCPVCKKGDEVIRIGRFGKFLSCSRFPKCDYTATYKEILPDVKCPEDGGDVVIKRTRKGKTFYGCSNYPKCKWASWRKPVPTKPAS